jgi:AcrR family transcriptional regulator
MARPALTDDQKREIRHNIRAAASELHAKNGMKDISARAIAETAGVSVGTIYSHFGNLAELMQSLWKQPAKVMFQGMEDVASREADPETRLRGLFQVYIDFAQTNEAVYRGAFMYVRPEGHEKPEKVALEDDRLFSLIQQAITDGQRQGVFRQGDPQEITQTMWSGVHGAVALPTKFQRLKLDESRDRVYRMLELLMEWLKIRQTGSF